METDENLIGPDEAALLLGVTESTLRYYRANQKGPYAYEISPRVIRYKRADVISWRETKRRVPVRAHKDAHASL